jgi:replicative DNA helicase
MNIIAGRPSMGKTAVLINMAYRMAMQGLSVAFFSLESTKEELLVRLMNLVLNKNIRELIETKPGILKQGLQKLQQLPIYIDDHGNLDIVTLRSRIYQLQHTRKIDVVIIDYLQLMTTKNYDVREREVSELSRQLKIIAKDFKLVVLSAAQLNRSVDARTNKEPMLSDLRESGSIEQDADIVMFVYRDAYYNDTTQNSDAKIIVKKNRTTGGLGTLNLQFTPGIASLIEQNSDIPF